METNKITWVDSIAEGVIGNKIYKDDVEIADVGMGVQLAYDQNAVNGETNKYEVQAYTAAGQSTDEVIGVNVENYTTPQEGSDYGIANATYDNKFLDPSPTEDACSAFCPSDSYLFLGSSEVYRYTYDDNDISLSTYDNNTSGALVSMVDMTVKPDGSVILYGRNDPNIFRRTFGTNNDLTTLSSSTNNAITGSSTPRDHAISEDGTIFYVASEGTNSIRQYNLSDGAWTITTVDFVYDLDVSAQTTSPRGVTISPDGKVLLVGDVSGVIYQYDLSTPWQLSSGSYSGNSLDGSTENSSLYGLEYNMAGTKIFTLRLSENIYQYSLNN